MPEIIFNGPSGRLEARYYHSKEAKAPVALVLHPHPLHGGTMNNKVVYSLFKALVNQGFSVLRFNFRGVGKSQGEYDDGIGELEDATCAMDWLQDQNPDATIHWIAGVFIWCLDSNAVNDEKARNYEFYICFASCK